MGAARTVFVVPDDSDKDECFGCRGSVVESVRAALRDGGADSVAGASATGFAEHRPREPQRQGKLPTGRYQPQLEGRQQR